MILVDYITKIAGCMELSLVNEKHQVLAFLRYAGMQNNYYPIKPTISEYLTDYPNIA